MEDAVATVRRHDPPTTCGRMYRRLSSCPTPSADRAHSQVRWVSVVTGGGFVPSNQYRTNARVSLSSFGQG